MKKFNVSLVWLIFSLTVLLTLSFFYWHTPPHADERHFIETIKIFSESNNLSIIKDYPEITPPLFYILFSFWSKLSGFSVESLRTLNLFISVIVWQLIFNLIRKITIRTKVTFLLSILLIANPYIIGISVFVYNDNLMLLFILSGVISFLGDKPMLTGLFFSLALLTRQYSIIFPIALFFYSIITSLVEKELKKDFLLSSAISTLPILVLFIYWQGLAPQSGLEYWVIKNRSFYSIDYINSYITYSTFYLLPLIIFFPYKKEFRKSVFIISILLSIILSFFPIKPSLATLFQTEVTTIGYGHKLLKMILGDRDLLVGIFHSILLLAGSYTTIYLLYDSVMKVKTGRCEKEIFFTLSWIIFLLVMPFSFQVWEKYLVMILPFYLIAIYQSMNHKSEIAGS